MALTFTRTGYNPSGADRPMRGAFGADLTMTMGEFLFDSSYASGGESLTPANVGLADIQFIIFSCEPSAGATSQGQVPQCTYDYDNQKVMAIGVTSGGPAVIVGACEVSGGRDLSAFTCRFLAFGHKQS